MMYIRNWLYITALCSCLTCTPLICNDAPEIQEDELVDIETFFDDVTEDDVCFMSPMDMLRNFDISRGFPQLATTIGGNPEAFAQTQTIARLLARGIYAKTRPAMDRNLLDIPAISYVVPHTTPGCRTYARSFYNHTSAVDFTQDDTIGAVTNLDTIECRRALRIAENFASDSLPEALKIVTGGGANPDEIGLTKEQFDRTIRTLEDLPNLDIPNTAPLFAGIQLQERRAGVMFEHAITQEDWSLTLQVPFVYTELNFFATQDLISRLSKTPLLQRLAESSGDDSQIEAFFKKHLVADRIGFGDIRLTWLHAAHSSERHLVWAGLDLTLPSAFDVSEGLAGSDFPEFPRQPKNEIRELINLASSSVQEALNQGLEDATEALDRLTRIFADRPLGQEHFGIAPIFTWQFDGTACTVTARARIEYLTPRSLVRFFLEPISFEEITGRDYTDDNRANENFDFLEDTIIRTLFPRPIRATVKPGVSPQLTMTIEQNFDTWRWHTGWDFWYYQGESISLPNPIAARKHFDVLAAERPRAYQFKLFGDASMDVATKHYLWHVGVAFDTSIAYEGIGQDATVSLYVGTTW